MSVVGIDLGTTNTVVGCVRTGKVHVLADEKGVRLLPSVVSFHPNGEVLVGGNAKQRRVIDAKNTVYSHKRLIGRSWGSPEIAQAKTRFAFELREGPGQGPLIHARGQDYTLPEISAFVLKRARQIAETALGTPVERAVITVPAHFNELQRASTKVAGRVSGLEVLRILNEPTAAALAYGLGRTGNERVAVYDFGGGTFDCTLLDLNGNVFEVLATAGDSFLGGDDVDQMIADRMAESFLKQHRQDAQSDPQMYERLKTTAEDIKIALSAAETHTVVLKEFGHGSGGAALNFQFTLTRKDLDVMLTPLVERTFKVTQDALTLARLSPTSFDKVILVGGSTRMPIVRKRVESFFGGPPMDRVNPDEVVAIGAAIQAAALTEGIRRRSIPAPPGVPGRPMQNDTQDNTQTSMELDPSQLKPAFGSEPPGFGFQSNSGSNPPQGQQFAFKSTVGSAAPGGVPGARPGAAGAQTALSPGQRKITNPGVAPNTQPMGARGQMPGGPRAPVTQATEEDPSMASFPDLSAPTPFEWFPSSGNPASGGAQARGGAGGQQSERSFGSQPDAQAPEPPTLTQTAAVPQPQGGAGGGPRPAAGAPFGAVDEPPSMFSTPSASVPSFPSMSAQHKGMPSPLGEEPEPWQQQDPSDPGIGRGRGGSVPEGAFGAVPDLSLISTSGISTSGVSSPEGGFGHVSDLSLISTSTSTAAMDAINSARNQAIRSGQFTDDEHTEAKLRAQLETQDPAATLDNSMIDRTDLPAVVQKAKPARKPGQVGMNPGGAAPMLGKPPPLIAPQPFGPMERVGGGAEESPLSRTAAIPPGQSSKQAPKAPPSKPQKPPPIPPQTMAMQGRGQPQQPPPLAATISSVQKQPPPVNKRPVPATEAFGSVQQPPAFTAPSAPPPPPPPVAAPYQPPPQQQPQFAAPITQPQQQQMPPQHQQPFSFGSAPPAAFQSGGPQGGFGSAPPPNVGGSQPPIFGAFASSPPDASQPLDFQQGQYPGQGQQPNQFQQQYDPNIPMAPAAPQGISYQSPVLVDVTPRGLVVETAGGYTDTIIPRNSKIPCERTRRFATGRDMQTTVRVRVGQGESPSFGQNTYLGEVELSGLRPASRGEVTVAVTFEVDADGTLRIRARDVQTGQEARATLQLIGVADESSVVMMINRFANQPVVGGPTQ